MKYDKLIESGTNVEEVKRQIKNFIKSKLDQEKVVIANMKQRKLPEEKEKEMRRLCEVRGEIKGLRKAYQILDSN